MYGGVGKTLKILATIFACIGMFISFVFGFMIMSRAGYYYYNSAAAIIYGFAVIIVGSFVSWLAFMTMAALGELVDNSTQIRKMLEQSKLVDNGKDNDPVINTYAQMNPNYTAPAQSFERDSRKLVCANCHNVIANYPCAFCGFTGVVNTVPQMQVQPQVQPTAVAFQEQEAEQPVAQSVEE